MLVRQSQFDMQRTHSIDLNLTINSGQVFLWNKIGDTWFGIDGEDLLAIRESFKIISSSRKIN